MKTNLFLFTIIIRKSRVEFYLFNLHFSIHFYFLCLKLHINTTNTMTLNFLPYIYDIYVKRFLFDKR